MQAMPLISGSSGNATLIKTEDSLLLIDAGCCLKKMKELLAHFSYTIDQLTAILLTHEHSDHVSGLGVLCRKCRNVPVYISAKSKNYLPSSIGSVPEDQFHTFQPGDSFQIHHTTVSSFPVPHDSASCVGFRIDDGKCRCAIATDIGTISPDTLNELSNCGLVMLEANYDPDMLSANEVYPYELKRRIQGPHGHLSNLDCGDAIAKLAKGGCRHFILAHLSVNDNMPFLATSTIHSILSDTHTEKTVAITPANRFEPTGIFEVPSYGGMV